MGDMFSDKYGTPHNWSCPDCGVLFVLYPALPSNHLCSSEIRYAPEVVYYFFRGNPTSGDTEFCITGQGDPGQSVKVVLLSKDEVKLDGRQQGDLTVFSIPNDWNPSLGILWFYDKRLQTAAPLPDELHQKEALRGRITG